LFRKIRGRDEKAIARLFADIPADDIAITQRTLAAIYATLTSSTFISGDK